jgi:hypothetical protein
MPMTLLYWAAFMRASCWKASSEVFASEYAPAHTTRAVVMATISSTAVNPRRLPSPGIGTGGRNTLTRSSG